MVDLTFVSRAEHFIPLTLLRYISETSELPPQIAYIGEPGFAAVKSEFLTLFWHEPLVSPDSLDMDLVTRGRLSVQRVDEKAWEAITLLAAKGWDDLDLKLKKGKSATTSKKAPATRRTTTRAKPLAQKTKEEDDFEEDYEDEDDDEDYEEGLAGTSKKSSGTKRKRKGDSDDDEYVSPRRASTRAKR